MGIDSCVHIPMDCEEDTKKRNMSREAQQGKQSWLRSHCMLDLFSSPTFNESSTPLKTC
jgi:hypothetical protein